MKTQDGALIIGAAILDIPAGPVDGRVFQAGRQGVGRITLGYGGDALNEATVLARLGHAPRLVSVVGEDDAGRLLLAHCRTEGLDTEYVAVRQDLDTGINLVLVAPDGERHFVTAERGGLRALGPEDVPDAAFAGRRLLSFASIFVMPYFAPKALAALFGRAKAAGLAVCADMTRPKNGETVADLREALACVDFFFPNEGEAAALTGETEPDAIADALLEAGVGCVVLKRGAKGCFVKSRDLRLEVPAYPVEHCLDTTGAGDTFVAGFLAGLLEERPLAHCAGFACACASLAVEALGATSGLPDAAAAARRWEAYREQFPEIVQD